MPVDAGPNKAEIMVVVDVPERIVAMRQRGRPTDLVAEFDSVPGKTFPLSIKESSAEADPKTGAFEIVTVMPRPEGVNILPGMTATVVARRADFHAGVVARFVVPASAVFADHVGAPNVWIVDAGNRVHKREVNIGPLTGTDDIFVVDGLGVGDIVAVSAVARLREGMTVHTSVTDAEDGAGG